MDTLLPSTINTINDPNPSNYLIKETVNLNKSKDMHNRTMLNDYVILKTLGEGLYSKIKLCLNTKTNTYYAIKIYNKDVLKKKRELLKRKDGKIEYRDAYQDIINEISIMKKINNQHDNIIKLYEIINDKSYPKIYLIIEYCEKGQLLDWDEDNLIFYSKRMNNIFTEQEICYIFHSIVLGLEYLHDNKIIHRDLKPQNLLENKDGIIKIADFDISISYEADIFLNKTKGTVYIMSPELCKETATYDNWFLGVTSDIWALGCTLYCFVYQKLPFYDDVMINLINMIEKDQHQHYYLSRKISDELKDLIDKLLEKNPEKRITIQEIKKHPWIVKNFTKMNNIGGGMTNQISEEDISNLDMKKEKNLDVIRNNDDDDDDDERLDDPNLDADISNLN